MHKKVRVALLGAMSMLAGGQALATPSVPSTTLVNHLDQRVQKAAPTNLDDFDKSYAYKSSGFHEFAGSAVNVSGRGDRINFDFSGALSSYASSWDDHDGTFFYMTLSNVEDGGEQFYFGGVSDHWNGLYFEDTGADYGILYGYLKADKLTDYDSIDFQIFDAEGNPVPSESIRAASVCYYKLPELHNGGEQTINVNLDSPVSLEDIQGMIDAKDLFGRDVDFILSPTGETYDATNLKLGTYTYTLKATDEFDQTATATLKINVVDIKAPTVTVKEVEKGYSKQLTFADLQAAVTASDKSTSAGGAALTYSFNYNGTAITQSTPLSLTADMAKAGAIQVDVAVSDGSKNTTSKKITVRVKDDVAPVISRKSGDVGATIDISLAMMENPATACQAWLANYTATDAVDGAVSVTQTGFPASLDQVVLGETTVHLTATDKAGNRSEMDVKINVTADESTKPYFVLDDMLLSTTAENPLSAEDVESAVAALLQSEGVTVGDLQLGPASLEYYLDNSAYTGEYQIAYTYATPVSAQRAADDGAVAQTTGILTIANYGQDKDIWTKIKDFFVYGWQRFCNWLSGKGWKTDAEVELEEAEAAIEDTQTQAE